MQPRPPSPGTQLERFRRAFVSNRDLFPVLVVMWVLCFVWVGLQVWYGAEFGTGPTIAFVALLLIPMLLRGI